MRFRNPDGTWKCEACGACCRFEVGIKLILPGYWDEEKKRCKNLNDDMKCIIYDTRPDACRTKRREGDDELLVAACTGLEVLVQKEVVFDVA